MFYNKIKVDIEKRNYYRYELTTDYPIMRFLIKLANEFGASRHYRSKSPNLIR